MSRTIKRQISKLYMLNCIATTIYTILISKYPYLLTKTTVTDLAIRIVSKSCFLVRIRYYRGFHAVELLLGYYKLHATWLMGLIKSIAIVNICLIQAHRSTIIKTIFKHYQWPSSSSHKSNVNIYRPIEFFVRDLIYLFYSIQNIYWN